MTTFEFIITIGTSMLGSAGLSTFLSGWMNRKKTKAEADTTISDAAIKFNDQLTTRIDKLEKLLEDYRRENLDLHRQVARLETEVNIYKQYMPKAS